MFTLPSFQIYGLQQNETNGMKVTANFLEKLIKSEVFVGATPAAVDAKREYELKIAAANAMQKGDCNHYRDSITSTAATAIAPLEGSYETEKEDNLRNGDEYFRNDRRKRNEKCQKLSSSSSVSSSSSENYVKFRFPGGANRKFRDSSVETTNAVDQQSNEAMMKSDTNKFASNLNANSKECTEGDNNVMTQKSDEMESKINTDERVNTTKSEYEMQKRRYLQMITFLDQQNQRLERELAKEKCRRTEELSRVIKSLLCFEAKLKHDKKVINSQMYCKDTEIARLVQLNILLKSKFPDSNDISECYSEVMNQYNKNEECKLLCHNCRNEFYEIKQKDNWTQISKGSRLVLDDQTEQGGSSSDETVSSSFYGARRSVRYTSKRTFGTFRDYMKSRSMNIDDDQQTINNSEDNFSIISSRDENKYSKYDKLNAYSRAIDRLHGIRRVESIEGDLDCSDETTGTGNYLTCPLNGGNRKSVSASSSSGLDDGHSSGQNDDDECSIVKMEQKRCTAKEFTTNTMPKQEFETSTDDWYASGSDGDDANEVQRVKPYAYNAVNPVLECVNQILLQQSMEESINDTLNSSKNGNNNDISSFNNTKNSSNSSNSSQSLSSSNYNGESNRRSGNLTNTRDGNGNISRKRVHFSTKNSMVHVPRDDIPPPTSLLMDENNDNESDLKESVINSLNYESIYGNEYEPIGSEHNSSNLYVDMESKLSQDDRNIVVVTERPKQPPALPPKPANLMKLKKTYLSRYASQLSTPVATQISSQIELVTASDKTPSSPEDANKKDIEPDYCSISEVNEAITSVEIVADVHKVPDTDEEDHHHHQHYQPNNVPTITDETKDGTVSEKTTTSDDTEETFADVPKLPNVAAIIAPKTPTKFISPDNYVSKKKTSSPYQGKEDTNSLSRSPKLLSGGKQQGIPNILAEINKRKTSLLNTSGSNGVLNKMSNNNIPSFNLTPKTLSPTTKTSSLNLNGSPSKKFLFPSTNKLIPTSPTALKSPLIGTITQSTMITETIPENGEKLPLQAEFDWYNLDAEYGKSINQPDVIKTADLVNGNELNATNVITNSANNVTNNVSCSNNNNNVNISSNSINSKTNSPINDNFIDNNQTIEYNLDEEFSLMHPPDIIKENVCDTAAKATIPNPSMTVCERFPTIADQSPCTLSHHKKLKLKQNFNVFLDNSGLSTKPLPRQRKIYFSGPFV